MEHPDTGLTRDEALDREIKSEEAESSLITREVSDSPEYEKPPVTEVVLSVQFEPLHKLKGAQIGLLWTRFRNQFPNIEEHPPLPQVIEVFGEKSAQQLDIQFQLSDSLPVSRTWFLSDQGEQLIQVQPDRFVHNWRKVNDEAAYPRYDYLVTSFRAELHEFQEFLHQEGIGELTFNQCEVTYVNHIVVGENENIHDQLERVLSVWSGKHSDGFLPSPEDVRLVIRYVMSSSSNTPLGRLHVNATPAFRVADKKPVIVLNLTARSRPEVGGLEGIDRALDLGHDWVVRGFTSITTASMHQIWERRK